MKKIFLVYFLFATILIFGATDITTFSEVQQRFQSHFEQFLAAFQSAAKGLLYSLAVISLVVNFGLMAVRGELEITGATAQLVKYALIVGFFSALINSPTYLKNIFTGVNHLAISAGGDGADLDKFMINLGVMWDKVIEAAQENGLVNVGNTILQILAAFLVTIPLVLMAGNALMYYAFSVLSINVGILFLGFGSYEQTRPWAINAIANILRNALKWMIQVLMITVAFKFVEDLSSMMGTNPSFQNILALAIVILLLFSVNSGIGSFVDSYFTGSGGGENSRGTQLIQTAMNAGAGAITGGLAGAKGAADTIAAAKASGQEMGTMGKIGAYAGGLASGAAKGGVHGGDSFAKSWAKGIDPNSSGGGGGNTPQPDKNKDLNNNNSTPQDGDVGGGTSGSIAEPKVGGEINKNQY